MNNIGKLNILLIDDNKTVLLITQALLKKDAHVYDTDILDTMQSVESLTSDNLIEIASNYDVIICDNDLQERIEGFDFLINLDNYSFQGLKILLTGDESYEMNAKIKTRPDIHYVTKSINTGESSTNAQLGKLIKKYREQI